MDSFTFVLAVWYSIILAFALAFRHVFTGNIKRNIARAEKESEKKAEYEEKNKRLEKARDAIDTMILGLTKIVCVLLIIRIIVGVLKLR